MNKINLKKQLNILIIPLFISFIIFCFSFFTFNKLKWDDFSISQDTTRILYNTTYYSFLNTNWIWIIFKQYIILFILISILNELIYFKKISTNTKIYIYIITILLYNIMYTIFL